MDQSPAGIMAGGVLCPIQISSCEAPDFLHGRFESLPLAEVQGLDQLWTNRRIPRSYLQEPQPS